MGVQIVALGGKNLEMLISGDSNKKGVRKSKKGGGPNGRKLLVEQL